MPHGDLYAAATPFINTTPIGRTPTRSAVPFLRQLEADLIAQLTPELETTLRVAVCSAGGLTRPEIIIALQAAGTPIDDTELKMCLRRLQRITNPGA